MLLYDKGGEEHFNLISALHKCVRRAIPTRRCTGWRGCWKPGEDRLYLARRLVRMAIEDIGLADPRALEQAMAAQQAVHFLGIPEGDQALAQMAMYLAMAPKSDAAYKALNAATRDGGEDDRGAGADAFAECAHRAHEGVGLRRGLPARAQFEDAMTHGMPAAIAGGEAVLPSHRPRHGEAHRRTDGGNSPGEREARLDLLVRRDRDFDLSRAYQLGYTNGRAGRPRFLEIGRVDRIHSLKQLHVRQVHLHGHRVIERHARLLQHEADVFEALLHFRFEVGGDCGRLQVLAGLASDIKRVACQDAGAERLSRGKFFGLNCFLGGRHRRHRQGKGEE